MGALYKPQKVKGHPNSMTLEKITQSHENITLTSCLRQGLDLKKRSF